MVEGAPHTAGRDQLINLFLEVPPVPVYKGARGEAGRPSMGVPGGGVLLLEGVGLPFPTPTRKRKGRRRRRRKEKEEKEERGGRPPSPIRFGLGGSRALPPLFHHLAHEAHYFFLVFP